MLQRQRNGSLATEAELAKLFSNIDKELSPWRKRGDCCSRFPWNNGPNFGISRQ